jgi:hypothetical protein
MIMKPTTNQTDFTAKLQSRNFTSANTTASAFIFYYYMFGVRIFFKLIVNKLIFFEIIIRSEMGSLNLYKTRCKNYGLVKRMMLKIVSTTINNDEPQVSVAPKTELDTKPQLYLEDPLPKNFENIVKRRQE